MAVITGGRVNRFLQKYLGIKGEIVAPEIGPELHPIIAVTDLPTELRFLDSIRSFYAYETATGDATHPAIIWLANPPGSNVVAVLERLVVIYTPAAMGTAVIIGPGPQTTAPSGGFGVARDFRMRGGGSARSTSIIAKTINAAQTVIDQPMGFPANSSVIATTTQHLVVFQPRDEWVITPGSLFGVATSANAESLATSWTWRERTLEPSELTA